MDHLYGWLFTYNSFTDKWAATPKDYINDYFNGDLSHCIRSSAIETLKWMIIKGEGSIEKVLMLKS